MRNIVKCGILILQRLTLSPGCTWRLPTLSSHLVLVPLMKCTTATEYASLFVQIIAYIQYQSWYSFSSDEYTLASVCSDNSISPDHLEETVTGIFRRASDKIVCIACQFGITGTKCGYLWKQWWYWCYSLVSSLQNCLFNWLAIVRGEAGKFFFFYWRYCLETCQLYVTVIAKAQQITKEN